MAESETVLLVGGPAAGVRINIFSDRDHLYWETAEGSAIIRVVYERVAFSYGAKPSRSEPMAMFVPSTVPAAERGRFCMSMLHEAYPDPTEKPRA